jgi:hypothetical protein
MSIAVNVLSLCPSEGAASDATASLKHMIISTLEESWPGDHALPVSMLGSSLDGPTKVLLQAAINDLLESGAIEFAYREGWSVGVRLTTRHLARPSLAYSRATEIWRPGVAGWCLCRFQVARDPGALSIPGS